MRKFSFTGLLALLIGTTVIMGFASQDTQLTRPRLREMLVELGYEVTDISKEEGKEKFSVKFTKNQLNIPVGFEISPSNSYIWLTVNLGDAPKEGNTKCLNLLKQNSKTQPTFFYVTESGRLMAALPVENRNVSNAVLRLRAETVSDNVGKTKEFWQAE
ncbi:MAG: hypothetical protein ABL949_02185 [Fimbriimonadaceae bacterium]